MDPDLTPSLSGLFEDMTDFSPSVVISNQEIVNSIFLGEKENKIKKGFQFPKTNFWRKINIILKLQDCNINIKSAKIHNIYFIQ